MAEIIPGKIVYKSCTIHFLRTGKPKDVSIVFLHGMKFQAATWKELGTLDRVAEAGFQAIALDMPGFGLSPACPEVQEEILDVFLDELGLEEIVLVGPSMGGRISLEFTIHRPERIKALVLVGTVGVEENRKNLSAINAQTLLVWGKDDNISPLANCEILYESIPNAQKIIIEGASHPCYLDNPDTWHSELINFLNSVTW